jgi:hypothetical protein
VEQGFTIPQSWSLLEQTMAAPLPEKPGAGAGSKTG